MVNLSYIKLKTYVRKCLKVVLSIWCHQFDCVRTNKPIYITQVMGEPFFPEFGTATDKDLITCGRVFTSKNFPDCKISETVFTKVE